jgi:hypothetical protein
MTGPRLNVAVQPRKRILKRRKEGGKVRDPRLEDQA